MIVAAAHDRSVFIGIVDVKEHMVIGLLRLETPEALGPTSESESFVIDESIWLIGSTGWVLEVDWVSGDVLRWQSVRPLLDADGIPEHARLFPGTRLLWVETTTRSFRDTGVKLVNVDSVERRADNRAAQVDHGALPGAGSLAWRGSGSRSAPCSMDRAEQSSTSCCRCGRSGRGRRDASRRSGAGRLRLARRG